MPTERVRNPATTALAHEVNDQARRQSDSWQADLDRVLALLEEADGPLSSDEIAMLAHLGSTATESRLADLLVRGDVARVTDPDDRRRVLYTPIGGGDDGE
jgi:DNA-binding MarR family transcriptional regulator